MYVHDEEALTEDGLGVAYLGLDGPPHRGVHVGAAWLEGLGVGRRGLETPCRTTCMYTKLPRHSILCIYSVETWVVSAIRVLGADHTSVQENHAHRWDSSSKGP